MVALPLHLLTATLGGYMSYFLLSVLTLPSSPPLGNGISQPTHMRGGNPNAPICQDWAQGRCTREFCRFRHSN